MREVKLYGHLGDTFGRSFELDVSSPAEAIAALSANFPNFKAYLTANSAPGYRVVVGKRNIGQEELRNQSKNLPIKIIPVLSGAGNGAGKVILGVILVIIGAVIYYFGGDGSYFIVQGIGMIIGGVAQMLNSPPKQGDRDKGENTASYSFNGAVNTIAQGNPVPICYGELIIGSQVVSAGFSTEQVLVTDPTGQVVIGGGGGAGQGGSDFTTRPATGGGTTGGFGDEIILVVGE